MTLKGIGELEICEVKNSVLQVVTKELCIS